MRKTRDVEINDELYVVHELRVGDMMKIMPRLADEKKAADATMDLMKLSVHSNGKPMAEALEDVGLSTYMELTKHVMEVNGLQGKG